MVIQLQYLDSANSKLNFNKERFFLEEWIDLSFHIVTPNIQINFLNNLPHLVI
jgi:hypothetical protein